MGLATWSRESLEYGRKVFSSGLKGARSGREAFLHGKSVDSFLGQSVQEAFLPAALGMCIGALGSCAADRENSTRRTLGFALLGGMAGFTAGLVWANRRLAASAASGALKNVNKVRDEHWFDKHPIDYA